VASSLFRTKSIDRLMADSGEGGLRRTLGPFSLIALGIGAIIGAGIFGIGWGLGGLCPGPALAGLVTGSPLVLVFVAGMIAGQWLAGQAARRDK